MDKTIPNNKYKNPINYSPVAYQSLDDNGLIIKVNDAWLNLFKYNREDIEGIKNIADLIDPNYRKWFCESLTELISKGTINGMEYIFVDVDGKQVCVRINGEALYDDSGDFICTQCALFDITEFKRIATDTIALEKHVREYQKLEAIGTLAGGVSHDFNNILQVILGFSELLLLDIDNNNNNNERYINAIREATNNGAKLTRQLKYFSGKDVSCLEPVDINNTIKSVMSLLEHTVPKTINIKYDLHSDVFIILADKGQLEQVIMNLTINATQSMVDGGNLYISTYNKLSEATDTDIPVGSYVVLSIMDTGYGIPKEHLNKIFNPFFSTKKYIGGSGLGLSVVYGIIKNHKGHIECESTVGEGTVFKVYLPVDENLKLKLPIVLKTENIPLLGTETVLVIDDEYAITELAENILTTYNYNVIVVNNCKEALDIYKTKGSDIDIVILDLDMPVMHGSICLENILEIDPEAVIVIASGHYDDEGPVGKSVTAGATGYLTKPFTLIDLLSIIRQILDR